MKWYSQAVPKLLSIIYNSYPRGQIIPNFFQRFFNFIPKLFQNKYKIILMLLPSYFPVTAKQHLMYSQAYLNSPELI